MKRTTEWTCDICEKVEVVNSDENHDGTELPFFWEKGNLRFKSGQFTTFDKSVIMCNECQKAGMKLDVKKPSTRQHLKLPFYKRIFKGWGSSAN